MLDKRTDDLSACDRTDLLVDKAAVIRDSQFEDIALNKLRFAGVVGRYRVGFAVGTDHALAVKDALDDLAGYFFWASVHDSSRTVVAND
jgi:hypothetical protein